MEIDSVNTKDMHDIKVSVLRKLGYRNRRTFTELKGDLDSSKLSFHLNKLQDMGVIDKKDNYYSVTDEGKSLISELVFQNYKSPLIGLVIVVFTEDKEKVYLEYENSNLDPLAESYRFIVKRVHKGDSVNNKVKSLIRRKVGQEPIDFSFSGVLDMKIYYTDENYQHFMDNVVVATVDEETDSFYNVENLDELNILPGGQQLIESISEIEKPFLSDWIIELKEGEFQVEKLEI